MFSKSINIFQEVIRLAREVSITKRSKEGGKLSPEEAEIARVKEQDLIKYLEEQDIEVLKDIITVMYIGIDMDHDKEESPEIIFNLERMFHNSQGWPEKDILIYTISNKSLLDEFLKDGLKVLKVEI